MTSTLTTPRTRPPPPAAGTEAAPARAGAGVPAERELPVQAIADSLRCSAEAAEGPAEGWRDTVLDGALALEQLQAKVSQERGHFARLEAELRRAYANLSATRAELLHTQAGERRQRHNADHDSLTALPNRRCFHARLDHALSPADQPAPALAVLYLDLDGFKPINDEHGHAAGDELLRIVAERLSGCVRAEDMVCRLGGDEFACLLSDPTGREQLGQMASKLFDAVSAPLQVGGRQLSVRPSIGIAVCPDDGDTAGALLTRADAAMYHAKRKQLGYAFFDRRSDS